MTPQYPSGYRYALHYGYTDGRGTVLRYETKTKPRDVTSATRPKRRPKSSFREWWHFVIDSSTKSTSYHDY